MGLNLRVRWEDRSVTYILQFTEEGDRGRAVADGVRRLRPAKKRAKKRGRAYRVLCTEGAVSRIVYDPDAGGMAETQFFDSLTEQAANLRGRPVRSERVARSWRCLSHLQFGEPFEAAP